MSIFFFRPILSNKALVFSASLLVTHNNPQESLTITPHITMSNTSQLFIDFISTIKELRGENGCPWDKRQTADSLVKHLKSELSELLDAIALKDPANICEEAGDILYLIVMIAEIGNDAGQFSIDDVIQSIDTKLIRRHPHVFAGQTVGSEEELKEQWQAIKAEEKSRKSN